MTKKEIKTASDSSLIVDYVRTYSSLTLNINLCMGTKRLAGHSKDLEAELVKRGILTAEQVELLNM